MLREDRADQLVDWRIRCLPGGSAVVLEQPAVSPADECAVSLAVVGDWCNDAINDTGTPSPGGVFDPGEESCGVKPRAQRVLRALDHLRDAGVAPGERTAEAIGIVESKRDADGRWPLEHAHHNELVVDLDEAEGH